jgi:hypothetical protein
VPREKPIPGFHYSRKGEQVALTPSRWRSLFSTHTRRVENGETFFINRETKRIEYEAYAVIRP